MQMKSYRFNDVQMLIWMEDDIDDDEELLKAMTGIMPEEWRSLPQVNQSAALIRGSKFALSMPAMATATASDS
jgi:hypothetical protein